MMRVAGSRPRVVVLGGGYAGVEAVKSLQGAPADVTLVDQKPYQTLKTRLWQLAVGEPGEGTESLQELTDKAGAHLCVGEVSHIDTVGHHVEFQDGPPLDYDYLVVALGSRPGQPGGDQVVLTLDQPEDARRIREAVRVEAQAALASHTALPIVVVGGGATGVEMAGIVHDVVEQVSPDLLPRLDLRLVHSGQQLSGMPEEAAQKTASALAKLGVRLELGQRVAQVNPGWVELQSGQCLPAACVLWATGTQAPALLSDLGATLGRSGRVEVSQTLTLPEHPEVFVVGDAALLPGVPPNKRAAKEEAGQAAANLRRALAGQPMEPFVFEDGGKEWHHIGPVDLD